MGGISRVPGLGEGEGQRGGGCGGRGDRRLRPEGGNGACAVRESVTLGERGVRGDPFSHQLPWFMLFLCGLHFPLYFYSDPSTNRDRLKFASLSL